MVAQSAETARSQTRDETKGFFSSFKKKITDRNFSDQQSIPGGWQSGGDGRDGGQTLAPPSSERPGQGTLSDPRSAVTPSADIRNNVLRAIAASRPESGGFVKNKQSMKQVKESEGTYCDSQGVDVDLVFLSDVCGLRTSLGVLDM